MNPRRSGCSADELTGFDAGVIQEVIDQSGFRLSPSVLDPDLCAQLAGLYDGHEARFRSTIAMGRCGFGRGEYKCFARPLPRAVDALRKALDARLAPVSRPRVIPMAQGVIAIIPVKERPVDSSRGVARIQVRHGVSELRRGLRRWESFFTMPHREFTYLG